MFIHADEDHLEKRIETFIVGQSVAAGEKVHGDKHKASYLLPDEQHGRDSSALLISETVVPGFEYRDHDFLSPQALKDLVGSENAEELSWLLSLLGKQ
jgi:predicted cupin superfamily sugar epimerase